MQTGLETTNTPVFSDGYRPFQETMTSQRLEEFRQATRREIGEALTTLASKHIRHYY
jgi:hypothetical protein